MVVVVPSDFLVSTQPQLWLFCCWDCGCCWAVPGGWWWWVGGGWVVVFPAITLSQLNYSYGCFVVGVVVVVEL